MNRLVKFTREARETLARSQEEALRLQHSRIRPEHMLLALTEDNGIVGKALAESGASPDKLRQVVVEATPQAVKAASRAKELELDDATKKLVENAVRMAINGEDQHIGTQHLLLALIALQDPRTQAILESAGLDPEAIRQKLSPGEPE